MKKTLIIKTVWASQYATTYAFFSEHGPDPSCKLNDGVPVHVVTP